MSAKHMFVYMTTNLVNGKRYIGKHTTNSLDDSYLGSGTLLKEDIEKYGKENFKRDILCLVDSIEELNEKERFYISQYNAQNDPSFYNLLPGGDGGCATSRFGKDNPMYGRKGELSPVFGTHLTEAAKEKLRKKALERFRDKRNHPSFGVKRSEESREKMRKAKDGLYLGKNNPNYGKKANEATRKKMSENRKGLTAGSRNPKAKQVICVETGNVYECITFAAKKHGCDRHWIADCCKGTRETAAGFHWKYAKDISHVNTVPSRSNPEGVSTISEESKK